jgi:hypothetical protein
MKKTDAAWAMVMCAGLIALFWVYCSLRTSSLRRKFRQGAGRSCAWRGRRLTIHDEVPRLIWHLLALWFIAYGHFEGGWTWTAIGVSSTVSPPVAFAAGCCLYLVCRLSWAVVAWARGRAIEDAEAAFRVLAREWPRSRIAKSFAMIGDCLNPFTEEIISRGMLVRLPVSLGAPVALTVAVGLLLNLGAHAYQGTCSLPYHAVIFVLSVMILFSPLGLVGAIGCHFVADVMPVLCIRRTVSWIRRSRLAAKRDKPGVRPA